MNINSEPSAIQKIQNTASDIGNNISEKLTEAKENITEGFNDVRENINQNVNDFSSNSTVTAANNFLDMNSTIAKFAFLILVVVAFLIFFNLGMQIIGYFFSTPKNPYLVDGQRLLNNIKIISQNPKDEDSITIPRSNNAASGIEFTWSSWISYGLGSTQTNQAKFFRVFNKGDTASAGINIVPGMESLNNAPGVYFGPSSQKNNEGYSNTNTLWVLMDTVNTDAESTLNLGNTDDTYSTEYIQLTNIPINKYFHLAIVCKNKFIDIYINGTVVSHTNLINVPKQNYYPVNIGDNGLSNSFISNLRYFSSALSVIEINTIVANGPNLNNEKTNSLLPGYIPNYISSMWYQSKIQ